MCIRKYIKLLIISLIIPFIFSGCIVTEDLSSPENINVINITKDSAFIYWDPVQHATMYDLYYQAECESKWNYEWITEGSSVKITDLLWDETYTIKIIPQQTAPKGKNSFTIVNEGEASYATFKTLDNPSPEGEMDRPKKLTGSINSEKTQVELNWTSVDGADYYDIECFYYAGNGSNETRNKRILTVDATTLSVTDNFTELKSYKKITSIVYTVCARDSEFSNKCWWSKPLKIYLTE